MRGWLVGDGVVAYASSFMTPEPVLVTVLLMMLRSPSTAVRVIAEVADTASWLMLKASLPLPGAVWPLMVTLLPLTVVTALSIRTPAPVPLVPVMPTLPPSAWSDDHITETPLAPDNDELPPVRVMSPPFVSSPEWSKVTSAVLDKFADPPLVVMETPDR